MKIQVLVLLLVLAFAVFLGDCGAPVEQSKNFRSLANDNPCYCSECAQSEYCMDECCFKISICAKPECGGSDACKFARWWCAICNPFDLKKPANCFPPSK
eukprot:TRINITY_DN4468_c0_g1_i3.p2 TRINITY_DN4468_c0_g1~~TRINITY_DN4468_c0_g1_i3.p2  ORF type:complete len:100 (+),score=6.37 TRINITY_DN4468_c0_g1_i3:99-398(+)